VNGAVTHDVIIAGGGVAGCAAAAALAQLNYRVLVVEPGMDYERRLAGELIHPPGVADLHELGLTDGLRAAGGTGVQGFAVFAGGTELLHYGEGLWTTKERGRTTQSAGTVCDRPALCSQSQSHGEVQRPNHTGLAIEHGAMARTFLNTVETLSNVTVWRGWRVTRVDLSNADSVAVIVVREGHESRLSAALVVAADGRMSHMRRMAGIADKQAHISSMVGFMLNGTSLPESGFGHVFADGPAPVLAYAISAEAVRIMFDVAAGTQEITADRLEALPERLRGDVVHAMRTQAPLRSANYSVMPREVVRGRFACVGDAGGCCHPVTATGLSACARDALLLRNSIRESQGDLRKALPRYAALRAGPQRARMLGAGLLYEVLKAASPEMKLLRRGLLRYWKQSPRGRAATMALLCTDDRRLSSVVREYMQVCRYALPELVRVNTPSRAMAGLPKAMAKLVRAAMADSDLFQ
jgi:squalene monooxygenase